MNTQGRGSPSLDGVTTAVIADALRDATTGTDIAVIHVPEYDGAVLTRCCVSVYVLLNREPLRIGVECCHQSARDPYKVAVASSLEDAVSLAVAEFDNV